MRCHVAHCVTVPCAFSFRLPYQDGTEDFYAISEAKSLDVEKLNHLKEVLTNAEPIKPDLWRAERLFHCQGNARVDRYIYCMCIHSLYI